MIVVGQVAAVFGCFALAARLHAGWHVALLAIAFGVLMNSVYSTIHEAEHAMLFPGRRWNDLAGSFMSLFFPAPFHLIRQGHLGHHMRNRSDDEAFDLYFEGEHPVWKRLQLYGILTGCYYLVVALSNVVVLVFPFVMKKDLFQFDRPSAAFMEALNPKYRKVIALEGLLAIALHVSIVRLFGIPLLTYAALYFAFGFMWSAMQYVHHFGTERHVTKGARNLWIWRPLDAVWMNHNWHQTHHEHPTVPWPYLPQIGRAENPSRGFLPWAYLRMWRGPSLAKDHVENKYAGRVIN
jgi:fatty acid desaturase